jgi:hypothetical protein
VRVYNSLKITQRSTGELTKEVNTFGKFVCPVQKKKGSADK